MKTKCGWCKSLFEANVNGATENCCSVQCDTSRRRWIESGLVKCAWCDTFFRANVNGATEHCCSVQCDVALNKELDDLNARVDKLNRLVAKRNGGCAKVVVFAFVLISFLAWLL